MQTPTELPVDPSATGEPAPLSSRALATGVDVLLLLVIDVLVVYFTLKICRVSLAEFGLIPKAPLLTFLLLQNGGYFVAFTATGQTLGKMVAGVRVLADDDEQAPDVGRSALRAGLWLLLALPAGSRPTPCAAGPQVVAVELAGLLATPPGAHQPPDEGPLSQRTVEKPSSYSWRLE